MSNKELIEAILAIESAAHSRASELSDMSARANIPLQTKDRLALRSGVMSDLAFVLGEASRALMGNGKPQERF